MEIAWKRKRMKKKIPFLIPKFPHHSMKIQFKFSSMQKNCQAQDTNKHNFLNTTKSNPHFKISHLSQPANKKKSKFQQSTKI